MRVAKSRLDTIDASRSRIAAAVEVHVLCSSSLVSDALAKACARRLRNLYVCEGSRVSLTDLKDKLWPSVARALRPEDEEVPRAPRVALEIVKTTPSGCAVQVRKATAVTVTFDPSPSPSVPKRRKRGRNSDVEMLETAASEAVREMVRATQGPTTMLLHGAEGVGKSAAARLAATSPADGSYYPLVRCEVVEADELEDNRRSMTLLTTVFRRAAFFAKCGERSARQHDARFARDEDEARTVALVVLENLECLGTKAIGNLLGDWIRDAAAEEPPDGGRVVIVGTARSSEASAAEAFEVHHLMRPPDGAERRRFVAHYFQGAQLGAGVLDRTAAKTIGYVARDLFAVCSIARCCSRERTLPRDEEKDEKGIETPAMYKIDVEQLPDASREDPENKGIVASVDVDYATTKVTASCLAGLATTVQPTRWADVGGQREAKRLLQQAVEWPISRRADFERFGLEPVRGVLMHGPPGCSKTLLARACATEVEAAFISLSAADVYSAYVGEAEATVRRAFAAAEAASPCILFFDEIDALVTDRSTNADPKSAESRVLATFLTCLDGVLGPNKGVVAVGATNQPHAIDAALLRPGRLEIKIYVALPDRADRVEILEIHARRLAKPAPLDLRRVAAQTRGFSGADLANVCREAAMAAARRMLRAVAKPPEWPPEPPRPSAQEGDDAAVAAAANLPLPGGDDIYADLTLFDDRDDDDDLDLHALPIDPLERGVTDRDFDIALGLSRATFNISRAQEKLTCQWDDHVSQTDKARVDAWRRRKLDDLEAELRRRPWLAENK